MDRMKEQNELLEWLAEFLKMPVEDVAYIFQNIEYRQADYVHEGLRCVHHIAAEMHTLNRLAEEMAKGADLPEKVMMPLMLACGVQKDAYEVVKKLIMNATVHGVYK